MNMFNKALCDEIIDDIVRDNRGDKDAGIIIFHSNGEKIQTINQYIIFEEDYLKILNQGGFTVYILYSAITAIYGEHKDNF